MTPNQQYADAAIIRAIELQALATHILIELIARLEILQRELRAAVAFYAPIQDADAESIIAAARQKIEEAYAEIARRLESDLQQMAEIAAEKERQDVFAIFGIDVKTAAITVAALRVLGLTIKEIMERQREELAFRTAAIIGRGVQNQDTLAELLERLEGSSELGSEAIVRVVEPSQRSLESATRTATEAVQEKTREAVAAEAAAIVEAEPPEPETPAAKFIRYGWQSIAVLDSRTTQLCRQYDRKIWTRDFKPYGGHALPYLEVPRHPYCRSHHVIVILDDKPAPRETFAQWMARQDEAERKRIFGAKALRLWKEGKIADSDLIRSRERQLTFDDLKKRK